MNTKKIYVASSWRNSVQPEVVQVLRQEGHEVYDFKNPPRGTGFSWKEVLPKNEAITTLCEHCGDEIVFSTFAGMGLWEPDYEPSRDPEVWRHSNGYAGCKMSMKNFAAPKKGTDLVTASAYLEMVNHERAQEGFASDFDAMNWADTLVLVLPCGKSAHLELGWAAGAGKRTSILLEDPIEPELMYRMVDNMSPNLESLVGWLRS